MKSSVTKPATAVEQCQVKSRKGHLASTLSRYYLNDLRFSQIWLVRAHNFLNSLPFCRARGISKAVSEYEVPKKFPGAPFSVSFSQLPAVKGDMEIGASVNFFGPSYFVMALVSEMSSSSSEVMTNE